MATSDLVREFAANLDTPLAKAESRGRLSKAAVDAWNEANPSDLYAPAGTPTKAIANPLTVVVVGKNGRKRPQNFKFTPAQIREQALALGLTVPARGRVSSETVRAVAVAAAEAKGLTLA